MDNILTQADLDHLESLQNSNQVKVEIPTITSFVKVILIEDYEKVVNKKELYFQTEKEAKSYLKENSYREDPQDKIFGDITYSKDWINHAKYEIHKFE